METVLKFSGINGYVDCGNASSLDITGSVTIGFLCQGHGSLITKGPNSGFAGMTYSSSADGNSNTLTFDWGDGTNYIFYRKGYYNLYNNLYHLFFTRDNATIGKIYVNGEYINPAKNSGGADPISVISNTNKVLIGTQTNKVTFYNGYIYEVAIYAEALTQTNIQNLVNSKILPTSFASCRLWHNYRLGNANDQSGNGNNGKLYGDVSFIS